MDSRHEEFKWAPYGVLRSWVDLSHGLHSLSYYWSVNLLVIAATVSLLQRSTWSLFLAVTIVSLGVIIDFFLRGDFTYSAIGRFSKIMCTAPFGLGVVLLYMNASPAMRVSWYHQFTAYINFAVVGNIAMMILVPSHGEYRAVVGKFACGILVVWLLQEMSKDEWRTLSIENGAFVFHSLPMEWVYAHTIYRLVLISLSAFDSLRYIMLEPTSLCLMIILSWHFDPQHERPMSHYFGFADTITAALTALTSAYVDAGSGPFDYASLGVSRFTVDAVGVTLQIGVVVFALQHVIQNLLETK